MDSVETALTDAIRQRFGREADLSTRLDALGVDSLQMADLVDLLERRFRIEVDQDLFEVETLADLADYVRARR